MTKIDGRTKEAAAKQIEESLKRLQTDHIDLMQIHEVIRLEDPDRVFAQGGAIEALEEARKAGKIRFIGFTGHKDPLVHLRMLEVAKQHNFHFDTAQMPLNVMDAHFRSFSHQVVPRLVEEKIGVLGMKSMGDGIYSAEQHGDPGGVPALRHEPAGIDGDHRNGKHGSPQPGAECCADVQAPEQAGNGGASSEDRSGSGGRQVREVQDHLDVRRDGAQSAVARVKRLPQAIDVHLRPIRFAEPHRIASPANEIPQRQPSGPRHRIPATSEA